MESRHLTDRERHDLAALFGECDISEFLHTVAGLVGHNVADLPKALEAQKMIRKAAQLLRGEQTR